jgi:hypothetical protein
MRRAAPNNCAAASALILLYTVPCRPEHCTTYTSAIHSPRTLLSAHARRQARDRDFRPRRRFLLLRRVLPQMQTRCTTITRETPRASRRHLSPDQAQGPTTMRALQLPPNRHHLPHAQSTNRQRRAFLSAAAPAIELLRLTPRLDPRCLPMTCQFGGNSAVLSSAVASKTFDHAQETRDCSD